MAISIFKFIYLCGSTKLVFLKLVQKIIENNKKQQSVIFHVINRLKYVIGLKCRIMKIYKNTQKQKLWNIAK